ncbi:hypothetical protein MUP77_18150 [Candidatus Bathyarchaeota archaeon]|nr:hypothetical protein [Candidatus Bathyarchaeota archaeon]
MAKTSATSENPHYFASNQHTYSISDSVALRIYSDTKPQNLKIANLQKGIIFLYNETEVAGEGTGFGVPIGKYSDETFFSGSSFLQVHNKENSSIIRKEFSMDLIARDKFRNLKPENKKLRRIIDSISSFYQKHQRVARFILLVKELLFKFGVETIFSRVDSKGKVIVTYTLDQNRILVKLSFHELDKNNLLKVFVLNEQGTHFFKKYTDSEGIKLSDQEIGAWDNVTAQSAKITDKQDRSVFSLMNVEGTMLRRGRELAKNSLDWIGLDYELNPKDDQFEYEIKILVDQR